MESAEEKRFREYLQGKGLKFTMERRTVLNEVFNTHGHFEAEDIAVALRERGTRVSRASVYRTLPLLVESGMLRHVYSAEKHSHYEHVFGHEHHDHLVCTRCGRTTDFFDSKIEELQDAICRTYGFESANHELEIIGLCSSCSAS